MQADATAQSILKMRSFSFQRLLRYENQSDSWVLKFHPSLHRSFEPTAATTLVWFCQPLSSDNLVPCRGLIRNRTVSSGIVPHFRPSGKRMFILHRYGHSFINAGSNSWTDHPRVISALVGKCCFSHVKVVTLVVWSRRQVATNTIVANTSWNATSAVLSGARHIYL